MTPVSCGPTGIFAPISTDGTLRLAYLATGYPFPSHTFIQGEVLALRAMGVEISTFTPIRSPDDAVLSKRDVEARDTTFSLRPVRPWTWARAHLAALRSGGWVRGLRAAWGTRLPGLRGNTWPLFYFGQAVVLWWGMRRAGLRHVHVHFANNGSDIANLACAVGGEGWTWSLTMHGSTEFFNVDRFRLGPKVEAAAFVVCISHFTRSQLMMFTDPSHWDKLRVVRCGVDRRTLPPPSPGGTGILCVARLVSGKGQPQLVDAVAALRAEGVDATLTLVGAGPLEEALREQVRQIGLDDHVRFTGAMAHGDVLDVVAECAVFCLPSYAEGVPVSVMEALALGKPAVSTRLMGIPELVIDGETGVLVTPGDLTALTDALRALLLDPDRAERLGAAGAQLVADRYDLQRETAHLRDVFDELVPR